MVTRYVEEFVDSLFSEDRTIKKSEFELFLSEIKDSVLRERLLEIHEIYSKKISQLSKHIEDLEKKLNLISFEIEEKREKRRKKLLQLRNNLSSEINKLVLKREKLKNNIKKLQAEREIFYNEYKDVLRKYILDYVTYKYSMLKKRCHVLIRNIEKLKKRIEIDEDYVKNVRINCSQLKEVLICESLIDLLLSLESLEESFENLEKTFSLLVEYADKIYRVRAILSEAAKLAKRISDLSKLDEVNKKMRLTEKVPRIEKLTIQLEELEKIEKESRTLLKDVRKSYNLFLYKKGILEDIESLMEELSSVDKKIEQSLLITDEENIEELKSLHKKLLRRKRKLLKELEKKARKLDYRIEDIGTLCSDFNIKNPNILNALKTLQELSRKLKTSIQQRNLKKSFTYLKKIEKYLSKLEESVAALKEIQDKLKEIENKLSLVKSIDYEIKLPKNLALRYEETEKEIKTIYNLVQYETPDYNLIFNKLDEINQNIKMILEKATTLRKDALKLAREHLSDIMKNTTMIEKYLLLLKSLVPKTKIFENELKEIREKATYITGQLGKISINEAQKAIKELDQKTKNIEKELETNFFAIITEISNFANRIIDKEYLIDSQYSMVIVRYCREIDEIVKSIKNRSLYDVNKELLMSLVNVYKSMTMSLIDCCKKTKNMLLMEISSCKNVFGKLQAYAKVSNDILKNLNNIEDSIKKLCLDEDINNLFNSLEKLLEIRNTFNSIKNEIEKTQMEVEQEIIEYIIQKIKQIG